MRVRTVLCFGDSNTHGTMAMRWATDRRRHDKAIRWTSVMARKLGPEWDVISEGHPGRTAVHDDPVEGTHKNGLRCLLPLLESHRPIDLVIVMLGTNDMKARFGVAAQDIALGVQRVATEIQRSDCGPDGRAPSVLLAAPVAVHETGVFEEVFAGARTKSELLPACLRRVADALGARFIDLNGVARADPVDGVHLDAAAHGAIGVALAEAVKKSGTDEQKGSD